MNRHVSSILLSLLFVCAPMLAEPIETDSLAHQQDSLIQSLRHQIQEMELQRIFMQGELERSGHNARMDSLAKVAQRRRVDSLRLITRGAPVVVSGDTLFTFYARKGGMLPATRAQEAKENIERVGHRLSFSTDSIYVFDGEIVSDVMAGDEVLISVTDMDGLWQDRTRQTLAKEYAQTIQQAVNQLHREFGLQKRLRNFFLAFLLLLGQVLLIRYTNRLFLRYKYKAMRRLLGMLKPIVIKDYEFLNVHRQGRAGMVLYRVARYLIIMLQLFISVPLLFSIFPETKTVTYTLLGYAWNPFRDILAAVLGFLPNLFKIVVIYLCFRYLVRGLRYLAGEIESERLRISGFYPDWARPTFFILRVLSYSLMFVMIWPLLPNSDSQIFQGVSVFIGLVVSLGSTSIIGNIMAGMVMTYMRPFRVGDYIKIGDTVGEVIEKTLLVTRIRTRKNEVVTIQNSSLMGSQTSNFTVAAQTYGLIVHTKVTIGYDVPWQLVKSIMESAAADTPGLKKNPKPFMMTTSLDDFYVEYEINAFTSDAVHLPRIYCDLHQNLLRRFFEAGVEIMSPHIYARRDGIDLQMPKEFTDSPQEGSTSPAKGV